MKSKVEDSRKFKFEGSGLEITIGEYKGNRQSELNSGVMVTVSPGGAPIEIPCNDFKSLIKTKYPSYKQIYSRQANKINTLIELLETIQAKAKADDLEKLETMKTCINDICINSLSGLKVDKGPFNPCQFFIPGKRVNPETFEMVDAEHAKEVAKAGV